MSTYTIAQIEAAINYWRVMTQDAGCVLGTEVRVLGDVYGQMIYEKRAVIAETDLTSSQLQALIEATAGQSARTVAQGNSASASSSN